MERSPIKAQILAAAEKSEKSSLWHFRETDGDKVLSDKIYAILLEKAGETFGVRCLYGGAGANKASEKIVRTGVSLEAAELAFNEEVLARRKKKYQEGLEADPEENFVLSISEAKKVPDGINDGFAKPHYAKTFGKPQEGDNDIFTILSDCGGDLLFSTFVVGEKEAIREFVVKAADFIEKSWDEIDGDPEGDYAQGVLLMWEAPEDSGGFSMAATIFSGEAYGLSDKLTPLVEEISDKGGDIGFIACDGNDNYPEDAFNVAIGEYAPSLEPVPADKKLASEAVARFTSVRSRGDIAGDNESFAEALTNIRENKKSSKPKP